MFIKIISIIFFIFVFSLKTFFVFADIPSPIPGNGTSPRECDVAWNKDLNEKGNVIIESLRHRIELYNSNELCQFRIFFLFKDDTITLERSLIIENKLHDRGNGIFTGTFIDGYGTKGITEKLNITIDALKLTEDKTKCAFIIRGGYQAKQQIHGLNIKVQNQTQAICDERGNDLLVSLSPNCPGKQGKDCDFKDLVVLTPVLDPSPVPLPEPSPAPVPNPTPLPKPDLMPIPSEENGSVDVNQSSGCRLEKGNNFFNFLAIFPTLLSLMFLSLCKKKDRIYLKPK